jgi:polyisoprenoid-binding protein YceI
MMPAETITPNKWIALKKGAMAYVIAVFALGSTVSYALGAGAEATADVPAGSYRLDKSHASLVFRVDHLGFSHYTARFTGFDAKLTLDPAKPVASQVEAVIDPATLDLDNPPPGFKEALLSAQWLDIALFSKITFRSTKIELSAAHAARITGDLTLHGVTKPVILETVFNGGYRGHPMDPHARIGFSAKGVLKRSDFGITLGIPAPGSKMGVSDEVEFTIEAEFTGPPLAAPKTQ